MIAEGRARKMGTRDKRAAVHLGWLGAALAMAAPSFGLAWPGERRTGAGMKEPGSSVALPAPDRDSGYALERALAERRSEREFADAALRLAEISQLLWAAQGLTHGYRSAPSAGALYPLEVYVAVGRVEQLAPGVYRYQSSGHRLARIALHDQRAELARAAYGQSWLGEAPAILVLAGVERRTTVKYGERGVRYVHMEAGHAAQNVLLQAVALGLGATPVGAFDDHRVAAALGLQAGERPLYLIPVGRPR